VREWLTGLAMCLGTLGAAAAEPADRASPKAHAAARALAGGINFGNMLDAPSEGAWGLRVEDEFIALAGTAPGQFPAVRLPVRWSAHASADAAAVIDSAFMRRVDDVVRRLLARGVTVVLNQHHYRQLDGDALDPGETAVAPEVVQARFLSMWRQIAAHFADANPRLLFELYNEPHGSLEPHWNRLAAQALAVVRERHPERVVIIGPVHWNNASALARLDLPRDPHLLLTVHNYEPFEFTHQGAEWVQPPRPSGIDCCSPEQLRHMVAPLDLAVQEAQRLGYPVFVGEFGAYSRAPEAARLRYLQAMGRALRERKLPAIYWELAAGFGLYDPASHRMRSQLRAALDGN
jgi:endoglucanase